MKSFFKKLAFVMAMAMVVSLAAPAAASAAEDIYLCYQDDATKTAVTSHTMKVDETQDFRFIGAPKNWKELGWEWKSTNPEVATVDVVSGDVTAVKEGTTVLQFSLGGEVVANTVIEVKPLVDPDTFTVGQETADALVATFEGESKLGLADATLYIVYPNESDPANPIKIKWPVDASKSKKDGNKIIITPYVEINDGDKFEVVIGKNTVEYTAKIGDVTDVVITAAKPLVSVDTEVTVTPKLLSNGVDVTSRYINKYEIEIIPKVVEGTGTDDDMKWVVNEDTYVGTATFFEAGMTATFVATVKDNKDKVIAVSEGTSITSEAKKPWSFEQKVVDWALIHEDDTKVDWTKKSVAANKSLKGEYSIVLKFVDNAGNVFVTQPNAVADKADDKAVYTYINGDSVNGDAISKAKYEVYYFSANEDVMLVDEETGEIGVFTEATGVFYIGLNYFGGDDGDVMKYIYAGEVAIDAPTQLDEVKLGKNAATVVTEVLDGFANEAQYITIAVEDQYNTAWTEKTTYSAYYLNKDNKKVELGFGENKDGKYCLVLSGANFKNANDAVETVTVEAKSGSVTKTATIDVTIVAPNYEDDKATIKLDVDAKSRYTSYTSVLLENTTADINAAGDADGIVEVEVTLYKTSGGAKVGTYTDSDEGVMYFEPINSEDELKGMTEEGSRYVIVKDPSGKLVTDLAWDGDTLVFKLNSVDNNKLTYGATGAYTVETGTVRYNSRNGNKNVVTDTATIEVENKAVTVKYDSKKASTFTSACYDDVEGVAVLNLEKVLLEVVKFTRDGKEWTPTAAMITNVEAVELSSAVILRSVTMNVPTDGANATVYTEVTIDLPVISVKEKVAQ